MGENAEVFPGRRVHLELRPETFVLYTKERQLELPYGDADEIVDHLVRVMSSEEYRVAGILPPIRGGEILNEGAQQLEMVSGRRLHFLCSDCGEKIKSRNCVKTSMRVYRRYLCIACMEGRQSK